MSGLGIILGSGQVKESFLEIRKEGFVQGRVRMRFISHHEGERGLLCDGVDGRVVSNFSHRK